MDSINYGPLELLVIQGSPFCNINCSYCYLPDRLNKKRISLETVYTIFSQVFQSGVVKSDFTTLWHAGEPLVLPISFYSNAINIAKDLNNTDFKITHNFQSNGTLIDEKWCEFFKEYDIQLSLSIDGSEHIHDFNRTNRKNQGTFKTIVKNIDLLRKHSIPFSVISVITRNTLLFPNEYYEFFKELNPIRLGFNFEEIEGANMQSSLNLSDNSLDNVKSFIDTLLNLNYLQEVPLQIREFNQRENFLFKHNGFLKGKGQLVYPYKTICVDINGNYSTFSPELLSAKDKDGNSFVIGNVYENSFEEALKSDKFIEIYSKILAGVALCKRECKYFSVCGGGCPSNKMAENGSFASTETLHCKLRFQLLFDCILEFYETKMKNENILIDGENISLM